MRFVWPSGVEELEVRCGRKRGMGKLDICVSHLFTRGCVPGSLGRMCHPLWCGLSPFFRVWHSLRCGNYKSVRARRLSSPNHFFLQHEIIDTDSPLSMHQWSFTITSKALKLHLISMKKSEFYGKNVCTWKDFLSKKHTAYSDMIRTFDELVPTFNVRNE